MADKKGLSGLPARFWKKLLLMKRIAADPLLPKRAKFIPGLIAAYLLLPIDLIPDFIPILGYLDDLIVVGLLLWLFFRLVPEELVLRHQTAIEKEPNAAPSPEYVLGELTGKN